MGADYSSFGLQDKVAIVTGASQGIGRAIALGLATAGAHVVLAKHPEGRHDEIKGVQAEIEALGRKAPIILVDVANVAQVRSLMEQTKEQFGRIDILVNNAGWTGTGPALDVTEEEYDRTMAASGEECVLCVSGGGQDHDSSGARQDHQHGVEFRRHCVQRPGSLRGSESRGASSFTRALAGMAKSGVLVNVVAPCITETDSRKIILERPGYKEWATSTMLPAGRWNQPEDLVGAVLFLSSHLSDMVVGHV
jgi:2-deoxy-D-gluconate 3-dehydrogenase